MFLENKYTNIYYRLVNKVKTENRVKVTYDGRQYHHIIPRSLGGGSDSDNIVLLTYKEHRVCHRLLIKMTVGLSMWKMKHAYKLFDKTYDLTGSPIFKPMNSETALKGAQTRRKNNSYKHGSENNFAQPEIIEKVRERMKTNNPMKLPEQRERLRQTNHRNRLIVTPAGKFVSRAEALRYHKFKHWKILYDLMEQYPDQYYWVTDC